MIQSLGWRCFTFAFVGTDGTRYRTIQNQMQFRKQKEAGQDNHQQRADIPKFFGSFHVALLRRTDSNYPATALRRWTTKPKTERLLADGTNFSTKPSRPRRPA